MTLEFQIGIALIVVGLLLAARQALKRRGAIRAPGRVIRVDISEPDAKAPKGRRLYKPTVRFVDGQDVVRFFTAPMASDLERKTGDALVVLYRADDPQKAWIEDSAVWVAPIVVACIGVVLAGFGLSAAF